MLATAEADLVRREAGVPGLATVLDPDAFVIALRRAAPAVRVGEAEIQYVRFKPGAHCRVSYRIDVGGTAVELDVRACRPEDIAGWLEEDEAALVSGPLGSGRLVFADRAVIVTVFPNDLKLPQLRQLVDPEMRPAVLRELLPAQPHLWNGELRRLQYRPERRYVAELRADGNRALIKAYTRRAYKRAKRHATAFRSQGSLRVADLVGWSDGRRLLAYEWLPGHALTTGAAAAALARGPVTATGAALADLHAQSPEELECWTPDAEASYVNALSAEIALTCPALAQRADALAQRVAAQLAEAPTLHCPVHGDFSTAQVLVHGDRAAIVDLDSAYCGDPADDLGKFIAHVEHRALLGDLSSDQVAAVRRALVDGYRGATRASLPERIELYTAVALIRRARFPLRLRDPDWPQRTAALLERAEGVIDARP